MDNVNPFQVEAIGYLASKGQEGEVGEGVGQPDPGEQLDVAVSLVQNRLDVGDVANIVAYSDQYSVSGGR